MFPTVSDLMTLSKVIDTPLLFPEHTHDSYMTLHEMRGRMPPPPLPIKVLQLQFILLAHGPFSLLTYIPYLMITHIPLVTGNIPIESLVARRWPATT